MAKKKDSYKKLTKSRALNDYTADKVTQPSKWEEPKKVAFCISTTAPGQSRNPIYHQQK